MDISRVLDNGSMCNCHWNTERADSHLEKLLYSRSLRAGLVNSNQVTQDYYQDGDMGEAIYYPPRGFSNDGSDFSDTSLSIACSTSTAPVRYEEVGANASKACQCPACSNPYANDTPRRRRRKVVTRSLVLDHGYSKSPQYNTNSGLSDSGLMTRFDKNPADYESSSSDCSNIAPVRVPRRKPKSHRRSMPSTYYQISHRPIHVNSSIPYTWVSAFKNSLIHSLLLIYKLV